MYRKILSTAIAALLFSFAASAQSAILSDFKPVCDSVTTLLRERTTVMSRLKLKSVVKRGDNLDFHFTETLGDFSWKKDDEKWLRATLKSLFPEGYDRYKVGQIYCGRLSLNEIVMPQLSSNGIPDDSRFRTADKKGQYKPLVQKVGGQDFDAGLSGRYIALWQSHGRYYETKTRRWEWQRAQDFLTVEDMYTQSYVLPFLIPMLENAGAYVMTPRERDTQAYEVVTDNDPSFSDERTGMLRRKGSYSESGKWQDAGVGFADSKAVYTGIDNPFTMGTARMAKCGENGRNAAEALWTPAVPKKGEYAVYISYKTLPNSTSSARYTVHHLGGDTQFIVNQKMGGGTWIYLGTFTFDEGSEGYISLSNQTPEGRKLESGSVVTADAVRIGGGMGKIARGNDDEDVSSWTTSGLPAFTEGALYSMQYAGVDTSIICKFDNDYTNDYADRGAWVGMMAGGSRVNPEAEGKGIPFDLSFAFHTDAGTTPNDSIIGTLAIYTLLCDDSRKLPDGEDRMACRELTDLVQTQIVNDVRAQFEPEWTRRFLWDKSYSESRTTSVPGMLLELLSHQNFADMKYGLDPTFRFEVSRAVYKGMLKFLSNRYGFRYAVEPLPVNSFAAILDKGDKVHLSWKATADTLEQTAVPTGFLLYTRIDDGEFDDGRIVDAKNDRGSFHTDVTITPGHIYSYKIVAFNAGGKSFPSEILCAGEPAGSSKNNILIVNDFYRLSAPAWFDTPDYAGFDTRLDRGVAYGKEINYIGEMYQFRRSLPWLDDDNPGFGASFGDEAGKLIAGNTFDYPSVHAKALLNAGYSFSSASESAFSSDPDISKGAWAADIICGKQVTTTVGPGGKVPDRYKVFPTGFQKAITEFTANGGNILISGANIGTDVMDQVYPVKYDSTYTAETDKFIKTVLGYKWLTNYASKSAQVSFMTTSMTGKAEWQPFSFYHEPNEIMYNVETPDGILPSDPKNGATFLRYTDTNVSAGVCYEGKGYKIASIGFPIETVKDEASRAKIITTALDFFASASKKR